MKYPDVIFATEKIGSNGIRCLDYKNDDDDVKYIRTDLVKLRNTPSNSDCAKCEHDFEPRKTWVHTCKKCGTVQIEKGHFA